MRRTLEVLVLFLFFMAPAYAAGPESIPRITVEELKARLDGGREIVILDVRSRRSYEASDRKIKGAVRIAPDEINARAGELPAGREIAAYCT